MIRKNPYETYKQQSVMTMTQSEMLLKLFDGLILQLTRAKEGIAQHDVVKANTAMQKSQKILNYLRSTLDFQYEISNQLSALYDYFVRQVIAANVRKDAAPLDEVLTMIRELRDTFAQAAKQAKTQ